MHHSISWELVKLEHEERIRRAQRSRQVTAAIKARSRPSFFKALLLLLGLA